ncbi:MAG: hypothetical protein JJU42_07675 [Rhodobacteraceae bacterium]|nr:hypothetical protein [Paracoccaceae bacterium]
MLDAFRLACVTGLCGAALAASGPAAAEDVTTCRVLDICAEGACGIEAEFTTLFLSDDSGRLLLEVDAVGDPLLLDPLQTDWPGVAIWGQTFGPETTLLVHESATGRLAVLTLPPPEVGHSGMLTADCERN